MNELTISLDPHRKTPLYEQIYGFIREEIRGGRIRAGERLPSARALSGYLSVSRSTVDLAYEQLVSEGYLESVPCKGYFVCEIEGLYRLDEKKEERQFCNARGIIVDQCIEEYGSGLNYNRKKWNKLLDEVMEQKVKTIIITHKDRFIRFGYDWFEKFCMKFNTTIVVVNNEELSPQEELVQDIVSILHVFSCRLYGLRKYKKQIERDEEIAKELQDGNPSDRRAESQDS